jgi:hypothetical protein
MATKLIPTSEQSAAFQSEGPILFVDAQGETTHVALPVDEARQLLDEHYAKLLAVSFQQEDAGQLEPFDIEATIAEAHRRYAARKQ